MPDNVRESSISPYNPSPNRVLNKEQYNLFAPVAGANKVGMAGYNPAQFQVNNHIVSLAANVLDAYLPKVNVASGVPLPSGIVYEGPDGIKTPNIYYFNYTNQVIDTIDSEDPSNNTYITVTGGLLESVSVWENDTNYKLSETLFANGRVWTRMLEVVDGVIVTQPGTSGSAVPY